MRVRLTAGCAASGSKISDSAHSGCQWLHTCSWSWSNIRQSAPWLYMVLYLQLIVQLRRRTHSRLAQACDTGSSVRALARPWARVGQERTQFDIRVRVIICGVYIDNVHTDRCSRCWIFGRVNPTVLIRLRLWWT